MSDAACRPARPDSDSEAVVPIERHSLLSDQRTAAIVTPDARVVWLCEPRIDSPPLLAELLGGPDAGFFSVRPLEAGGDPAQRYVGHSMVLETSWDAMSVIDYLDCSEGLPTEPAGRSRLVRVLSGTGKALVEFTPSPGPGNRQLECSASGIEVRGGDTRLARLRSPGLDWRIESHRGDDIVRTEVDLSTGAVVLELLCGTGAGEYASSEPERRSATIEHWRGWMDGLDLPPLQTDLVRRSALVLKALCHGPTGAIIAAPTTSLPQDLGGSRNWDYRYCWMRDASMAAAALVRLGSIDEAMDLLDWLLRLIDRGGAELDHLAPI
ncbi:MAG: trehalose-phosphatase, partial [Acidimicrobiia bacterium]|nr:trehalose-phosphatase [Acidimicrobiia bacterium]